MRLERKEALQKVNVPTRTDVRLKILKDMRPEAVLLGLFRKIFVRLSITLHAWHSVWAPES